MRIAANPEHDPQSFYIDFVEGMRNASLAADRSGLPQTLYRAPTTCGWANTNALSSLLEAQDAEVLMTVLPYRYFD